jgi:cytochrome oxidase Cu insertion factor (SCO1/SenC/PrrC family)
LPVWKNFFVHVKNETNSEHHNHLDIDNNHKHSDEEEPSSEDYIVQHSAFYFIFDINNKLKTILPFGSSIEEVEKELKDLL